MPLNKANIFAIPKQEEQAMVQQVRQEEPQYSCVIPIDSITGNQDEEIMSFGVSADDAKNQAAQLLANNYGCSESEILQLIQQARIEPLAHWCSPRTSVQ
jgi:hypothetical protein